LKHPKVSVIIPVYNGDKFLEEAIKSVLSQEYDSLECIVVDDGSIDDSAAVAKKFEQVVYLYQDNAGVASARNRGVRNASGEYLAFLDADDLWDHKKLAIQIRYLERNPELGYSLTKHSLFLADGMQELPAWVRKHQFDQKMTAYIPSALVVRKSVFEAVGEFNEHYKIGDDTDWFLRARDAGIKLGIIEDVLLYKRVHPQCLSSQTELAKKNLLKLVKASLQRARFADKVSVIVPVYNGEKYLKKALDSALGQSAKPCEVLVIDDGSTDTTAELARQYGERIRYIRKSNGGAAAARNDGIQKAAGDYVAFLDADDYWNIQKLEFQLQEIQKPGAANMIFGMSAQFYSPETGEDFRQKYRCPSQPMKGALPGTLLIKREDFLKVGLFSTEYKTGEFIEWYQRAQEAGMTSAYLPEVLLYRRIHPQNHGIVQKQQKEDYARIVKEMLLRRRKKKIDD
jgi:glycosyltransferase involved in cell wall biosynthesis